MPAEVVLGADVGTSGLKLVALSLDGEVVSTAEAGYAYDSPEPGWAQTDVGTWRRAFDDALGALDLAGRRVLALGLAGQMHGAVLVDAAGRPLTPALLWPDGRATAELARWRGLPATDRAALANPLVAGMTGPMLAWLATHRPDAVAAASAVLLPKDALRVGLVPGSAPVTDRSDASATLLWDVPADTWSLPAGAAAGVPPSLLPAVRPSSEVVGTTELFRDRARGVPVVVGGADTPLAMLAAGRPALQVNLGTGAQVLRPGVRPVPVADPVTHLYADVDDGWYAMAALRNGGSAWSWAAAVLGVGNRDFFDLAATAPAGADGARFAPWLTGERGGVARPDDRGGWTGLTAGTTRADLACAAVEGVAEAIAAAVGLLPGPSEGPVVLTGGGGRTAVVRTALAAALDRPVTYLPLRSASATGAALLAGRAVGLPIPQPERDAPPEAFQA